MGQRQGTVEDLELRLMVNAAFWKGKRVLITGHTGFKGGWLTLWLGSLGARICGIALKPDTEPNLFTLARITEGIEHHIEDIRNAEPLAQIIRKFDPDIVFHMAAQPLVRASYRDPLGNFDTNIMGTANVLEALRDCPSARSIVVITTDKVYENLEIPKPYKETDPLGGHDPYSASKAAAEIVTQSYRKSFFAEAGVGLATARAGNVIGGGDWSEDRLIPDAVKAWNAGKTLEIRAPNSVRPWQHVLDPLAGYITLAEKLWTDPAAFSQGWNFGPEKSGAVTVREVIDLARAPMEAATCIS
ncbi:MAG: CDP-glucose 4,6-dehydratase [Alphaproteobacteria bacterium]|nr:CDP-glucose 4,6-dehydratase [Alphaproteobacteria bacterium]